MKLEAAVMRDIRAALNLARDVEGRYRCRVHRVSVGFDEANRVRYGMPGEPDLQGVLRGGRAFAVEVKAGRGRLSDVQRAWWRSAAEWGITGGVAWNEGQAMELLERAERGEPPTLEWT